MEEVDMLVRGQIFLAVAAAVLFLVFGILPP